MRVIREPQDPMLAELRGRPANIGGSVVRDSIGAPPARVHAALVDAFRQLGIPTEIVNPDIGQVANTQFRPGRELAGTRLSRFLLCGETLTGPRADNDRVLMAVVSDVKPLGAGSSRIETRAFAIAIDVTGTGGRTACSSTGELEQRLHQAARAAVQ